MDYRFPKSISAARIATFVSTAAWIQGASAGDVSLPDEALDNFLKRHNVNTRQTAVAPGDAEEEEEEEASSVSAESDDNDASSADMSSVSSGAEEDAGATTTNQAGVAVDASGQPVIESANAPTLSVGAKAAIGIWVAVAVLGIGGLIFFFYRRRKRDRDIQEIMSARDLEIAASMSRSQPMSYMGAPPGMAPPPPSVRAPPPEMVMEPAHLRAASMSQAPSGQWVATPPWQDEQPTWRDSQPWRVSKPPVLPTGLPTNPSPRGPVGGGPGGTFGNNDKRASEYDRQTEYTAETESTIFAYR
ncbi:hypothetical protein F5Y15DRAFT_102084 [Xylariaceae sp. FL0016]|nr:hypothetical protein F5Y15DRAFT_102084 [Xylariaceae sp. FL0016]